MSNNPRKNNKHKHVLLTKVLGVVTNLNINIQIRKHYQIKAYTMNLKMGNFLTRNNMNFNRKLAVKYPKYPSREGSC